MDAETLVWILAAGFATAVGGVWLLAVRNPSERLLGLGIAAVFSASVLSRAPCQGRRR